MEGLEKYLESGEDKELRKRKNVETVKKYLEEQEIKFLCDDEDGFIAIGFSDVGIIFRISEDLISVQMIFFKELPDEAYQDVLVYLSKVNTILKEGHFEVEKGQGVSYRIATHLENGTTLSPSRVEEMMVLCRDMGSRFGPEFSNIIDNGFDGEEAFRQTIKALVKAVM